MEVTTLSNAVPVRTEVKPGQLKEAVPKNAETEATALLKPVDEAEQNKEAQQDPEQLQQVAEELSNTMSMMRKGLAFKVDETSGTHVVSVMDVDSGDVIRQIPSEEALELAAKLSEVAGLLMKTEA
ncbi:flagellar protein FlaG [Shewanella algae]|uniref:flagellar protein FlaG n=1 Tax=Shewanella algae TaxID=38313 RepID=UPI000BB64566|nr:flagellar protein FlaG [Shewanella algae]EKT4485875.1 flagellar protein FlaG [Shewanella algae]MBO2547178.1 flagellar protein FlaG [Shewanella algae]MBO2590319.1 flagellar protein FlaG [Shewanella algae]MBO2602856.1 flagellar protein FlaG [Shewanella algae]PBQ28667.1 flagellar biosynthesis protein FlaG [Shewanella algae]